MHSTRLTKQQVLCIRRTHSARIPAYLMRDDGRVIRISPGGELEEVGEVPNKRAPRFLSDCRRFDLADLRSSGAAEI
jgi:hypothetical protein